MKNTKEQKYDILHEQIQFRLDSIKYQIEGESLTIRHTKEQIKNIETLLKQIKEVSNEK